MALAQALASARTILDPLLAVVFPSRCPACGRGLLHPTQGPLCLPCWEGLPRHRGRLCRCGVPLPGTLEACGRCRRGLSPFGAGVSLGPYEAGLRTAIHELKYRGRRRVARRLAEALWGEGPARHVFDGIDALVPVPLHPRRQRERGFNQAELLARELSRHSGLPTAAGTLVRRLDTPSQAGLPAVARRRNVSGAFAVRRRGVVSGRRLLLVDDVVTTGATALACARALRAAGAREVRLLCVARVA
jgi:ComF family protein